MKTVSVIVPVYNAEKYISECIESILNQTFNDFELILIDDGSKDLSGEICRGYAARDGRVRYVYKENGGVSSARNCGIRRAEGEYIAFVDSDDTVKPKMLETLVRESTDFAMCGYELYDDLKKTVSSEYHCPELSGNIRALAVNIRDYICPPYLLGPCFKLFKRDIIMENGLMFPPELSYGEDAIFVFEYLLCCNSVGVSRYIGYSYRKYGGETLSGRFLRDKIDINYRINCLMAGLLRRENVPEADKITAEHILRCFVSYEKELICSDLTEKEKRKTFYEKYALYKEKFGKPTSAGQAIVKLAGKCGLCYPLMYLFGMKGDKLWKKFR